MTQRTAWRICSDNGWWSVFGKPKKGKANKPGPPVHDELCAYVDEHGVTRHAFTAEDPNQLWIGDITEHWTSEGKLYLSKRTTLTTRPPQPPESQTRNSPDSPGRFTEP